MCIDQVGNYTSMYFLKRMTSVPFSKLLSVKKGLFTNIKQKKSCQILISLNIHVGLVPSKRNMTQNIVGAGQAPSPPLTHDCTL